MSYLTDYRAYDLRVGLHDERSRHIENFTNRAAVGIFSNPSYKRNVLINGHPKDVAIISTKYPNEKNIYSFDQRKCFNLGELVKYQGSHWLIVEEDPDNDVYLSGRMKQCNYILRWQNPETLEIIERWSVVENPYSSGLDENKTIAVGGNQFRIKLQYDNETKLLHLDKRFLIGTSNNEPVAYSTVRFDDITNTVEDNSRGFLTIFVEQDVLREADDRDLMIADYIKPVSYASSPIGFCEITYEGKPKIRINGSAKRFTALFKDEFGSVISSIDPTWEIVGEPEVTNKVTILSLRDNYIELEVRNLTLTESTFVLKLTANHSTYGHYECLTEVKIEKLW